MISIFDLSQRGEWDALVRTFPNYDVYYLSGYANAFFLHGDGTPVLFYYETAQMRGIYAAMMRDVSKIDGFKGKIEEGTCFDLISPYGYGGFLLDGQVDDESLKALYDEFVQYMRDHHVVCNFTRYSPVLKNAEPMKRIFNVIDLGNTVAIDLSSEEVIWNNIISKNRNMIRKAEKNGIEIRHGKNLELFRDFKRIYNATMEKDHAEDYYFFEDDFYESIHRDLNNNYEMFYAVLDNQIIAMSIILYANKQMHYHLSGSVMEYRNMAPSNLLLYKAALWGHEHGFQTLHLGGGVGSGEDNLYKFKAAFNRHSNYHFSIGKEIFCQEKYNELVELRKQVDPDFNGESSFFPLYRA